MQLSRRAKLIGFAALEILVWITAGVIRSPTVTAFAVVLLLIMLGAFFELRLVRIVTRGTVNSGRRTGPFYVRLNELNGQLYLAPAVLLTWAIFDEGAPAWFPWEAPVWILVPWALFIVAAIERGWTDRFSPEEARERSDRKLSQMLKMLDYQRYTAIFGLLLLQVTALYICGTTKDVDFALYVSWIATTISLVAVIAMLERGYLGLNEDFKPLAFPPIMLFVLVPIMLTSRSLFLTSPAWLPMGGSLWILGAWGVFVIMFLRYLRRVW